MTRQRFGAAEELLATLPASVQRRNRALAPVAAVARRAPRTAPQRATAPAVALPPGAVVVTIDGLKLVNPLNNRQGWRAVSARGRREKAAVAAALRGRTPPALPVVVTIVRVSPGRLDDDGATASAKHVRDSVALWLGCDDADARVRFVVTQAKGAASVRVEVTAMVAGAACPLCGCVAKGEAGQ